LVSFQTSKISGICLAIFDTMWPNTIIAGAPKAGTSSLYYWLAAHPDVCSSKSKEPFYFFDTINRFNTEANFINHGLKKYSTLFDHCKGKKIVFEATAPYIYQSTALEQLPKLDSKPKMIFILREPSSRLYSKYQFNRYKLHNTDIPFKQYCTSEIGIFPGGKHILEGHYSNYLKNWKSALGEDRIYVMVFEETMKNPQKAMKELSDFLEIDSSFYSEFNFAKHNETFATKNAGLHKKLVGLLPYFPESLISRLGPLYRKLNSGKMPSISKEELDIRAELKIFYKSEADELLKLFPALNLSSWR